MESGSDLLTALAAFVNLLLDDKSHPDVIPNLFSRKLIPQDKISGGISRIAVGSNFHRAIAKRANAYATSKQAQDVCYQQRGVGVSGGCKTAVHAT